MEAAVTDLTGILAPTTVQRAKIVIGDRIGRVLHERLVDLPPDLRTAVRHLAAEFARQESRQ